MTAREELAQSIATNLDRVFGKREFGPATQDYELADALLAEGWGKRRTVATVEELDALPGHVLILTEQGGYWESIKRFDRCNWWKEPGVPGGGYVAESQDLALPAIVLYEPQP